MTNIGTNTIEKPDYSDLGSAEIESIVDVFLRVRGIAFTATYDGVTIQDDWKCFTWTTCLQRAGFPNYGASGEFIADYHMGLAHVTKAGSPKAPPPRRRDL